MEFKGIFFSLLTFSKTTIYALYLIHFLHIFFTGLALGNPCPDGWTSITPLERVLSLRDEKAPQRVQCIKQFTEKTTWYKAKAICANQKSKLLEINSPNENRQVIQNLKSN